jgi:hypothetical protein
MRKVYRILVGKPERKRTLGRRIILKCVLDSTVWYGLDSSGSGQGLLEGSFERGNEPSGSIKFWEFGGFSSRTQFLGVS